MSQLAHIMRKDVRRMRWDLTAWTLCIVASVAVRTFGADLALEGFGPRMAIAQLVSILAVIEALLSMLIISRLVHDEPLVGSDAFWFTRPISRGTLMAEKLLVAAAFFIALPLLGNVIVALFFGTPVSDVLRSVPITLLGRTLWVSLLFVIAVLTPSLMRYAVTIVGILGGLAVLVAGMVTTLMMFWDESESNVVGSDLPDPTRGVVAQIVLIAAALALVAHQYRTRRPGRTIALAGVGLLVVYLVSAAWPWSFAPPLDAGAALPPAEASSIVVLHDATEAPRASSAFPFGRRAPKTALAIRVAVSGLPRDVEVQSMWARSRLELPGTAVETNRPGAQVSGYVVASGGTGLSARALEGALGGARLLGSPEETELHWPTVVHVTEEDFGKYAAVPGRLVATMNIALARTLLRGTLPLAENATLELDSRRITIMRVDRYPARYRVWLRHTRVEPLLAWPRIRSFTYVLLNKARNEAVAGYLSPLSGGGFSLAPFDIVMTGPGPKGFALEQYELQVPAPTRGDTQAARLDDTWLDAAELAILESVHAGAVSRGLEIPDFRMRP
jgi:hypothetical protein